MPQLLNLVLYHKAWQEAGGRLWQRLFHPVTLGVRGIVLDTEHRVLLVRHTYLQGWYFPGGGVEPNETLLQALARELREEAHIELNGPAPLHGIFLHKKPWRSDHVACFIVRDFQQTQTPRPNWEIAEARFFDLAALPSETSRATRARLAEISEGLAPSPQW